MNRITLGVHVHTQPERLRATLASIERHTAIDHDLILLPDGPDDEIRRELTAFAGLRQLPDEGALGPAACLNRLARHTEAGIIVLIESGVVVGPRWLDHLVAALDRSPSARRTRATASAPAGRWISTSAPRAPGSTGCGPAPRTSGARRSPLAASARRPRASRSISGAIRINSAAPV